MVLPSMGQHTYHLKPRQRYQIVDEYLKGAKIVSICRFHGIPRKTLHHWIRVWRCDPDNFARNVALTDHTPKTMPKLTDEKTKQLILRLRRKSKFGPQKLQLLLKERGITMSPGGIYKVLKRAGLIKKHRKKIKKKYKKYTAFIQKPGEKVQVDVAHLPRLFGKAHRHYVYQAIDLFTRITFSAVYSECCPKNTVHFLTRALQFFPFQIETFQFDHGTEFTYDMLLKVKKEHPVHTFLNERNILFTFSPVATPRMNGCVERVHRSWREEVERWHRWKDVGSLSKDNARWMKYYNAERPHFGLKLMTPLQKLQTVTGFESSKLNYSV